MLGFNFRGNAVAEVEDVTAAFAVAGQNARHFVADGGRLSVEHGGVHVALQGNLRTHTTARFADIAGPVQTQCISASFSQRLQPQAAVFGEEDDRNLAPVVLADQAANDLLHIGQREFQVRRRR